MRRSGRSLAKGIGIVLLILLVLLWIGFAAMVLGAVALGLGTSTGAEIIRGAESLRLGGPALVAAMLAFSAVILLLAINLVQRLRRVVATVERGEPFHEGNPRDLRAIAGLLAVITLLGWGGAWFDVAVGSRAGSDFDPDLSNWLSVLIILVLAEVFREGARLRADAELTV